MSRKVCKRVCKTLQECPDVGTTIEDLVIAGNVGTDQWRRTVVFTFDGSTKLPMKVTYGRIQKHLQEVNHRHFSYGTVVQLCVPRNKRRRSAARYQGVAKVTTRRARKGFTLRYNPDAHWSGSLYKGLNAIQYKDGSDITNINRDDSSGFRLDTLTTNKQYATPVVNAQEVLTTRTDYVNKYSSTLQTTSYNFSSTNTTPEICVGVVKASGSFPKNPAQHTADLMLLDSGDNDKQELKPAFVDLVTGAPKPIDCIRVDGASDEGPGHDEVQFWWTVRHMERRKLATLVTTRSSGSSYLNRVELQNGCLSLGHAALFIPSTLGGSCYNPETGAVDEELLRRNHDLAIDAYISRVDNSPCGSTTIKLYKGADSSTLRQTRNKLLEFLKGPIRSKDKLRREDPNLFAYFQKIWHIRNRHMVPNLPSYIFYLLCCYHEHCPHPVCQSGRPAELPRWYPGGPFLTQLPPWSALLALPANHCAGHLATNYKENCLTDVLNAEEIKSVVKPPFVVPFVVLKELFSQQTADSVITENFIKKAAEQVLLPCNEVQIWLKCLKVIIENRKISAAKAAATRRAKRVTWSAPSPGTDPLSATLFAPSPATGPSSAEQWFCGKCGREYEEETEKTEFWIACDTNYTWYHCGCEKLGEIPNTKYYICLKSLCTTAYPLSLFLFWSLYESLF